MKKFFIVAHRGASAYELENTLEAFKKAIDLGAKFIECDVRKSKDNELVVIHDSSLQRLWRRAEYVNELNADELKNFKIPKLSEVIDLIKKYKDVKLLIEIKEEGIEEKLIDLLKKKHFLRKAIIVSFFEKSLEKIKQISNVKTGFIFSVRLDAIEVALKLKPNFIIPRYDTITKELIKIAHKNKMKVIAWTINDKNTALKLIKIGVDGIATDKPDLLERE
ncbi:MAG: glycerophosphodiester phosphodiesterase [Candidatus Pacearchaeota archaeon]